MSFAIGSLVKARDREWVVLPDSTDDLLMLRPLGGTDEEVTGILVPLEKRGVGARSPAGPVQARRLPLGAAASRRRAPGVAQHRRAVPLVRQHRRGAALVPARAAADGAQAGPGAAAHRRRRGHRQDGRGAAHRPRDCSTAATPSASPCSARRTWREQWQGELREKFHLDAQLVLPSTVNRLEKQCRFAESVFERFPFTVVSTDFIKQESRRHEFLQAAPELVIVDEAHTCVEAGGTRAQLAPALQARARAGGEPRRARARPDRHMILVTATPHSGKEEAFRSLLGLLRPEFADLPDELGGDAHRNDRRAIAAHFVQRRRADIRHYLGDETPFPERDEAEEAYTLTPGYKALFDSAIAYAREIVRRRARATRSTASACAGGRCWRCSARCRRARPPPPRRCAPAPPAPTPRPPTRPTPSAAARVFDLMEDEAGEGMDVAPGSDFTADDDIGRRERAKLLDDGAPGRGAQGPQGRRQAGQGRRHRRGAAARGPPAHRLLPLHPDRRLRGRRPARGAGQAQGPQGRRDREHHRSAAAGGARGAHRQARRDAHRAPRAGLHRLPERGHQPAGALRRRDALRPLVEPDPARAARGPRGPLRPAQASACAW